MSADEWGIRVIRPIVRIVATTALLSIGACEQASGPDPVVGAWLVHDSKAPFPMQMYVFNADGTMQQANPDAGDAQASDSDGKGIWASDGRHVRGKWVEIMADRATHRFTGRGEYSFEISVSGNTFGGTAAMNLFDANGRSIVVIPTTLTGERVVLSR